MYYTYFKMIFYLFLKVQSYKKKRKWGKFSIFANQKK